MNFVKHFFKRHLCVESIYFDDDGGIAPALKCSKCGREIGFIYFDKDGWKTFLHKNFKWYKPEIMKWVYEHIKDRSRINNSSEREWGEVLHNIKQWREDSESAMVCEDQDERCEENSDGCESGGAEERI